MGQIVIQMTPILLLLQGMRLIVTPAKPTTLRHPTTKKIIPTRRTTQIRGEDTETYNLIIWNPLRKTLNNTRQIILSTIQRMKTTIPTPFTPKMTLEKTASILEDRQKVDPQEERDVNHANDNEEHHKLN